MRLVHLQANFDFPVTEHAPQIKQNQFLYSLRLNASIRIIISRETRTRLF